MCHRFEKKEAERLSRELGVSHEEAVGLLKRAGGDYKRAVRLYISEHNIYVEPERVEDGKRSAADEAAEFLRGAWFAASGVCSRMVRSRRFQAALVLALMMLALTAAPVIAVPAALIGLFLRMRFSPGRHTRARVVF